MVCKYNEVKRKLKKIIKKSDLQNLFDSLALNENERIVMDLHYCERIQLKDIAKEIGYSEPGVLRIHKSVLEKLEPVLNSNNDEVIV